MRSVEQFKQHVRSSLEPNSRPKAIATFSSKLSVAMLVCSRRTRTQSVEKPMFFLSFAVSLLYTLYGLARLVRFPSSLFATPKYCFAQKRENALSVVKEFLA